MTIQRSQSFISDVAVNTKQNINTKALVEAVDNVMLNATQSEVELLEDASRHINSSGGKRVRPQMLLLTYLALGGDNLDYALPVAASVEMVHTASVVHDDINDHGLMRRGRPSVNALYGRTFALLTGDFLFTKVYELMAEYTEANKVLARATKALVEGETLQAAAVKNKDLSKEMYMRVIGLKTAELFSAATELGALLAGANTQTQNAMGEFGYKIGMAFQIIDDVLDITSDTEQLGKTAGIDAEQGKGIGSVNGKDPMETIRQEVMQGDAIEQGKAMARQFVNDALEQLDVLPAGEARDALVDIAHMVVERSR
jgi:geranylgeranyl pyrophosphate synthase